VKFLILIDALIERHSLQNSPVSLYKYFFIIKNNNPANELQR